MARTAIADIDVQTTRKGDAYDRSTTAASDGTPFASGDGAAIPGYDWRRDTILVMGDSAVTLTVQVNDNAADGRTNDYTTSLTTAKVTVLPAGSFAPSIFLQDNGELWLDLSGGNAYVTVVRAPVIP